MQQTEAVPPSLHRHVPSLPTAASHLRFVQRRSINHSRTHSSPPVHSPHDRLNRRFRPTTPPRNQTFVRRRQSRGRSLKHALLLRSLTLTPSRPLNALTPSSEDPTQPYGPHSIPASPNQPHTLNPRYAQPRNQDQRPRCVRLRSPLQGPRPMSLSQDQHRSRSTILHRNHNLIPRHSRIKSSLMATDTTLASRTFAGRHDPSVSPSDP